MKHTFRFLRVVLALFFFAFCWWGCEDAAQEDRQIVYLTEENVTVPSRQKEETAAERIIVYICGAVERPGVYELTAPARLFEAVEAAGGLRRGARAEDINLAQTLADEQRIVVPAASSSEAGVPADTAAAPAGKVNINTADEAALMTLTGIGKAKAEAIIEYRRSNGPFSSAEEIMKVPGIKESSFEKIRERIIV